MKRALANIIDQRIMLELHEVKSFDSSGIEKDFNEDNQNDHNKNNNANDEPKAVESNKSIEDKEINKNIKKKQDDNNNEEKDDGIIEALYDVMTLSKRHQSTAL